MIHPVAAPDALLLKYAPGAGIDCRPPGAAATLNIGVAVEDQSAAARSCWSAFRISS